MRRKLLSLILVTVIVLSTTGCGSLADRINRISIDMDKADIKALFGKSFTVSASKVDNEGNILELWEFYDKKAKATYQIYFRNDKVSQWGKRGDLQTFPDLHAPTTDDEEN